MLLRSSDMTLPLLNQAVCEEKGCCSFPKMHISDPWWGLCVLWLSAQNFRPFYGETPATWCPGGKCEAAPQPALSETRFALRRVKSNKDERKNELTAYGKVGATCPSRSTHGTRGNAGGEPLWDPQHWGWGSEAVSCSSPTLGGEDRNNGRRHLAEDLRENIPSAAMAWTTSLQLLWHACDAGMGAWEDHTHQEDHGSKKKKQKPPAHIVHWHLCQTLRGGLKSLFGNTRAPHERWAGQGESETKQKRKTDSKHKWGLLVGSAGDEEENDAPSFNKPKLPVLTSCSCGVQIPQSNSHSTHEASRNDHQCPPPGHSHEEGRQMRTWGLHLLRLLSKKNYTCICRLEWKKITRQPHVYGIFWR